MQTFVLIFPKASEQEKRFGVPFKIRNSALKQQKNESKRVGNPIQKWRVVRILNQNNKQAPQLFWIKQEETLITSKSI